MKNLIKSLFQKSIELGNVEYSEEEIKSNWIGNPSATIEMINRAEKKLKISLPTDYKELLLITNGFKTSNEAVEPNFLPIEEIDYLKNIAPFVIECYEDTLDQELSRSILIGGKAETQFLLIAPNQIDETWRYWKFAHWIPGEHEFTNLRGYLSYVIEDLNKRIEGEK